VTAGNFLTIVPGGDDPKIARRFNAGKGASDIISPAGTAEKDLSDSTCDSPSMEEDLRFHSSLRDFIACPRLPGVETPVE